MEGWLGLVLLLTHKNKLEETHSKGEGHLKEGRELGSHGSFVCVKSQSEPQEDLKRPKERERKLFP